MIELPKLSDFTKQLGRTTSGTSLIPEIDGLRFFAIISVVFAHIADSIWKRVPDIQLDPLYYLTSKGTFGVQFFFVISGFVLALPFARHWLNNEPAVSIGGYYLRRLTRIEPPYVFALVISYLLRALSHPQTLYSLFPNLCASIFYLHGLLYHQSSRVLFVAWSLEIEVQFYILAPLFGLVFAIRPHFLRRLLLLVGTAIGCAGLTKNGFSIFAYIQFFVAGILLADVYVADWQQEDCRRFPPVALDLIAALSIVTLVYGLIAGNEPLIAISPFFIITTYAAALRGRFFKCVMTRHWLVILGGMCYTIYLYHEVIIWALSKLLDNVRISNLFWLNFLFRSAIGVPVILLACSILFVLLEKPFMSRKWLQAQTK